MNKPVYSIVHSITDSRVDLFCAYRKIYLQIVVNNILLKCFYLDRDLRKEQNWRYRKRIYGKCSRRIRKANSNSSYVFISFWKFLFLIFFSIIGKVLDAINSIDNLNDDEEEQDATDNISANLYREGKENLDLSFDASRFYAL